MKTKGVFCIEGLWDPKDVASKLSVLPMLDLLQKRHTCKYVYHDCATIAELEFYLNKWKKKSVSDKYPILYLAFHGQINMIQVDKGKFISLDELGDFLENKCYGKVIYFGSCHTFNIDKRKIKSFLNKTKAIAAIGYKTEIDWLKATVCDLFVFDALQKDNLDSRGIAKIEETIKTEYGNLHKLLDLRFVINDMEHFPRKRKRNPK